MLLVPLQPVAAAIRRRSEADAVPRGSGSASVICQESASRN